VIALQLTLDVRFAQVWFDDAAHAAYRNRWH
jgi:hypothetical protein